MAGNNNFVWTGTTTTGTTNNFIHINNSTASGIEMEYEFPDWAEEGRIVIDKDDNEWLVVGQYVDEDNVGILQLENEDLGLEAEEKVSELEKYW